MKGAIPAQVHFTPPAEDDLVRLAEYLLSAARDLDDLERAQERMSLLREAIVRQLSTMPWSFRKAGDGARTTRRELVVPLGTSGYVALYEIESPLRVQVLAIRHQLEQDYH